MILSFSLYHGIIMCYHDTLIIISVSNLKISWNWRQTNRFFPKVKDPPPNPRCTKTSQVQEADWSSVGIDFAQKVVWFEIVLKFLIYLSHIFVWYVCIFVISVWHCLIFILFPLSLILDLLFFVFVSRMICNQSQHSTSWSCSTSCCQIHIDKMTTVPAVADSMHQLLQTCPPCQPTLDAVSWPPPSLCVESWWGPLQKDGGRRNPCSRQRTALFEGAFWLKDVKANKIRSFLCHFVSYNFQ